MPLDVTPLAFPLYGVLTALLVVSALAIAVAAVRLRRRVRQSSAGTLSPATDPRGRTSRVPRAA